MYLIEILVGVFGGIGVLLLFVLSVCIIMIIIVQVRKCRSEPIIDQNNRESVNDEDYMELG